MATVTITTEADTYSKTTRTDDDEAVALAACLYQLAEVSPSGRVAQIAEAVYRLMNNEPRRAVPTGRTTTMIPNPPHQQHADAFEDAHMGAAGAVMGARMAGKEIPKWSADMNEAFRAAVAEAFDAGAQAERKAAR